MVLNIGQDKTVTAVSPEHGLMKVKGKTIILTMGCRERTRGAIRIPGYRPAGVFTAGAAQRMVNMEGYLPGKKIVILGSGDIGLIMARRMTLEGCKVQAVRRKSAPSPTVLRETWFNASMTMIFPCICRTRLRLSMGKIGSAALRRPKSTTI